MNFATLPWAALRDLVPPRKRQARPRARKTRQCLQWRLNEEQNSPSVKVSVWGLSLVTQ